MVRGERFTVTAASSKAKHALEVYYVQGIRGCGLSPDVAGKSGEGPRVLQMMERVGSARFCHWL
jgi:hypothetical protein